MSVFKLLHSGAAEVANTALLSTDNVYADPHHSLSPSYITVVAAVAAVTAAANNTLYSSYSTHLTQS
jgi:hypothetical protein